MREDSDTAKHASRTALASFTIAQEVLNMAKGNNSRRKETKKPKKDKTK
jgi:hypothetical protein